MKIRVIVKDGNAQETTKVRYKIKVRVIEKEKPTFFSNLMASLKIFLPKENIR